jgi:hypothetical protein
VRVSLDFANSIAKTSTEIHCFKTNLGNLAVGLLGAAGTSETAPPAPTAKRIIGASR